MKNKNILYIGNDLSSKTNYTLTMDTVTNLLGTLNVTIYKSSSKSNQFLRIMDMCLTIIKLSRKVDYILIDTYSYLSFYFALITSQVCRVLNLKYLPILHSGKLPERLISNPFFSRLIFKNSYYNIAPSNYLKSEFNKFGFNSIMIPNVLEIDSYEYLKREVFKPKILYVRAFNTLYNPTLAVEVLLELKKVYPEAELCMIGPDKKDGTYEKVVDMIKKFKLDNSVELTGVMPKKDWHKKSESFDIFLNTTNFDNTPVSVMEAMALGLPVVSTNVQGIPYMVENGKEALLVDKENVEQMTDAVKFIIENPTKTKLMCDNARKKAESFGWDIVKNKWKETLNIT